MANLHDCLQRAMDAGELDKVRGAEAQTEFSQLVERYSQAMPIHQAEATAAAHLKEATSRAARSRRHTVLAQLQTMVRIKHLIVTAEDPAAAVRNLLEYEPGSGFKGESIEKLADAMIVSVDGGINDFLREAGLNITGSSRNKALMTDVMRELHLQDSGNPRAVELADAVRKQQTRLRQMFNAHGGDIGDLADFGASHSHDAMRIRKLGVRAWSETVGPKLDWSRIENKSTGQSFVATKGERPDAATEATFLQLVFDGITTKGWNVREPSMTMGGKALYNQRAEHRVLHFLDADNWLSYNKEFGTSDPFSALTGGLHGMARDIAMMRVLGPNPKMGLEYATQVAKKHAVTIGDVKLEKRVGGAGVRAKTMLAHFDGSVNHTEWAATSAFFSGTSKVLTSIQLGSAALSAVTDMATISVASRAVGMNASNVLSRHVELMANSATRETAARMGYVAETLADAGSTAARWTGDTIAPQLAERLSGFTMRASGLSYWTDMAKTAFRMEFSGLLADNTGRAFDQIDEPLREILTARGITAADWEHLRDPQSLFRTDGGATFLSPIHWLNRTPMPKAEAEGLALRLQMIIEEELELAVPTASLRGRSIVLGNTDPGQVGGILLRSTFKYKSFGLSLMLNQVARFNAIPTPMGKAKYAASISAGLLLLGSVAIQLKEMAKGRDPRPMDDGKFWMAAMFQGGGLGIFGDFFASETSRSGGGIQEIIAGPVAGFAGDVIGPFASNFQRIIEGKETMFGRDAANFTRYNTPVASSLWYSRLAFDRIVSDQLQRFLDPDAEAQWHRQERRREREYGTATYWPRGELTPDRAPNLENALGANQ